MFLDSFIWTLMIKIFRQTANYYLQKETPQKLIQKLRNFILKIRIDKLNVGGRSDSEANRGISYT